MILTRGVLLTSTLTVQKDHWNFKSPFTSLYETFINLTWTKELLQVRCFFLFNLQRPKVWLGQISLNKFDLFIYFIWYLILLCIIILLKLAENLKNTVDLKLNIFYNTSYSLFLLTLFAMSQLQITNMYCNANKQFLF